MDIFKLQVSEEIDDASAFYRNFWSTIIEVNLPSKWTESRTASALPFWHEQKSVFSAENLCGKIPWSESGHRHSLTPLAET